MVNLWIDSLQRYGLDKARMLNGSSGQAWAEIGAAWTLSAANPRTGELHLRLSNGVAHNEARRVYGDQLGAVYFGQAIYASALPSAEHSIGLNISIRGMFLAAFRDQANNNQVTCWLGTDGAIVAYRDGTLHDNGQFTGTQLGRTAPVIGAGAYHHIEYFLHVDNATGALEIRVNEVTCLNLTGIDTVATGNVEVSQVAVGLTGSCMSGTIDMADVYVNDPDDDGSGCNDFIGDVKVGLLLPSADTAQADFTLSAGSDGYALLNETPPVDSSYISTTATTARSDFALTDAPSNTTEILTVRPWIRALKDDAGTCTMAPSLQSNSVDAAVADQPVTTAAAYHDSNVPFDPDTDAPWTLAGLNAARLIIERTA
ncbi:MAG TPA: hypothetical protein VF474_02000 [Phenylobacterium sp.]